MVKKIILIVMLSLLVLVTGALIVAFLSLNSIVIKGVETVGPRVTKVETKLAGATVSVFSGAGELKGLFLGNPQGFTTPAAIKVGHVKVSVVPRSLFASKIVVPKVHIMAPEITFEGTLKGNNLSKIQENVQAFTAAEDGAAKKGEPGAKKIQVDDLTITGGRINLSTTLLGGRALTVPLPDIHLTGLGASENGITPGELTEKVVKVLFEGVFKAVSGALGQLGKEAADAVRGVGTGVGQGAVHGAEKVTKGFGDLFKKK